MKTEKGKQDVTSQHIEKKQDLLRIASCKQRTEQSDRYAPFRLAIALGGKKQIMLLPVTRARSKIRLQRGSTRSV
jgi:hypothetical protein